MRMQKVHEHVRRSAFGVGCSFSAEGRRHMGLLEHPGVTALFLLVGVAALGSSKCPDCQAMKGAVMSKKK